MLVSLRVGTGSPQRREYEVVDSMRISDGSRTHHLEFGGIERSPRGDYVVAIKSPDDVRAHMFSVAAPVDGFMKVTARDARAFRVEVHDHGGRMSYRAVSEDADDVSGHVREEHTWEASTDDADDVEGHDSSKAAAAQVAFGAAAAHVALHDSDRPGRRLIHRIQVLRP
jgi:hypothetical protein